MPERRVDGRTVAFREAGTGAPALLIHCALAHSGAWSGVMAGLGDRLAMRAMDLPGHGGTGHDPRLGMQQQAVANALALLADRPAAHLVGHSFGATVALRLAIEAPARVASLTLVEPVAFALLAETDPSAFAAETEAAAPARALMAAGDWPAAAAAFLLRWGGAGGAAIPPAMIARMPLVAISDREIADPATATLRRADLARVRAPALLIAGADSPPAIAAILDALAAELPATRRVTVPGAGHMLPVSHPQAVSAAIRDFLGGDQP